MRGSRLALPVVTWDAILALLKQHGYTGRAILHCNGGQPVALEIPPEPEPGLRFAIDNKTEVGAK